MTCMTNEGSALTRVARWGVLALAAGCGGIESGYDEASGAGGAGVGQGGAQDFGQFREILEAGDIPGPETLDDVGFFNEHHIELPDPNCDAGVCLHAGLGVMGNMITGSNCTLMLIGMNTPLDLDSLERPPLNLAIAVDVSGSMGGQPISFVREGLVRMLDDLQEGDRVSIVAFSDRGELRADHADGASETLREAIDGLRADGQTNLYDGLRTAFEVVHANLDPQMQNRVLLLSDGEATTGITSDARMQSLAQNYALEGIGLTTIGMGSEFDPTLMRTLAETGSGSFYFLEDASAVVEVFEEEVKSFLVPLAKDVRIDVDVDAGYSLRAVYGTKRFEVGARTAAIDIPILQVAHRQASDPIDGGRRGGGGAILVELVPGDAASVEEAGVVGRVSMSYRDPATDEVIVRDAVVQSELVPGETPEEGRFSTAGVEKAFVTLNLFAGFQLASQRAAWGDDAGALAVLEPLGTEVRGWLAERPDPDITDDLHYLDLFVSNLEARGADELPSPRHPAEPWPRD